MLKRCSRPFDARVSANPNRSPVALLPGHQLHLGQKHVDPPPQSQSQWDKQQATAQSDVRTTVQVARYSFHHREDSCAPYQAQPVHLLQSFNQTTPKSPTFSGPCATWEKKDSRHSRLLNCQVECQVWMPRVCYQLPVLTRNKCTGATSHSCGPGPNLQRR